MRWRVLLKPVLLLLLLEIVCTRAVPFLAVRVRFHARADVECMKRCHVVVGGAHVPLSRINSVVVHGMAPPMVRWTREGLRTCAEAFPLLAVQCAPPCEVHAETTLFTQHYRSAISHLLSTRPSTSATQPSHATVRLPTVQIGATRWQRKGQHQEKQQHVVASPFGGLNCMAAVFISIVAPALALARRAAAAARTRTSTARR